MTRRRIIALTAASFAFGLAGGWAGTKLLGLAPAPPTMIPFLDELRLGEIIDSSKPHKATYYRLPFDDQRGRDQHITPQTLRLMEIPSLEGQARWSGRTDREALLGGVVSRLERRAQATGYRLVRAGGTSLYGGGNPSYDHWLFRCETGDGACVGMVSVELAIRGEEECRISVICSSAASKQTGVVMRPG